MGIIREDINSASSHTEWMRQAKKNGCMFDNLVSDHIELQHPNEQHDVQYSNDLIFLIGITFPCVRTGSQTKLEWEWVNAHICWFRAHRKSLKTSTRPHIYAALCSFESYRCMSPRCVYVCVSIRYSPYIIIKCTEIELNGAKAKIISKFKYTLAGKKPALPVVVCVHFMYFILSFHVDCTRSYVPLQSQKHEKHGAVHVHSLHRGKLHGREKECGTHTHTRAHARIK